MPLVVKDRVKETTSTTGTGTVTLGGAVTGFQSFSVIGNGNTTFYAITLDSAGEWEVGIGTYTSSGTTLSRDIVLESSNSGSLVSFSAGTKIVFCTYPADKSVYLDASDNASLPGNLSLTGSAKSITLGNTTSSSTATPEVIDMGGTFSNSSGQNLKIKIWNIGTNVAGFGLSLGRLEYVAPTGSAHAWYTGSTNTMILNGSNLLGVGPDATTPRQRITLGNTSSVSTATPESIDMGGTYSNAAASNLKLKLYNDTTGVFGVGVSASQMDYAIPTGSSHVWYIGGTARLSISSAGAIDMAATSSLQKNSTNAYALKNITYLTSGSGATYTTPTGVRALKVTVIGGGGGGGGADGQATASTNAYSGGGGGAGYATAFIATAEASYTYTVGSGGTGGAAGNNAGAAGGTTEFKNAGSTVIISATGGGGGAGSVGAVTVSSVPGTPGIGSITGLGSPGGIIGEGTAPFSNYGRIVSGTVYNLSSSGSCPIIGGGVDNVVATTGSNATIYGEGGGNVRTTTAVATNYAGGNGFAGLIIIEEYY